MGNKLSCYLKPNASPKLGGCSGPDNEPDIYEGTAENSVAEAPSPTSLEPTQLDIGASEQQHLQQIIDPQKFKAESALDREPSGDAGEKAEQEKRKNNDIIHMKDNENHSHALEISRSADERSYKTKQEIDAFWDQLKERKVPPACNILSRLRPLPYTVRPCKTKEEIDEFLDNLKNRRRVTSVSSTAIKPHSVRSHPLPSHSITPSGKYADSKQVQLKPACQTLPHPSHHSTPDTTINWGPLKPPKTPKARSQISLRPAPPFQPSAPLCYKEALSKSPKTGENLQPKCKPERKPSDKESELRKSTVALEGDLQLLDVIDAYHTSARARHTLSLSSGTESAPHDLLPETKSNGPTAIGEKSLVDTVCALKNEVEEFKQENEKMKTSLEENQRALRDLEKLVREVLKNMNPGWHETDV